MIVNVICILCQNGRFSRYQCIVGKSQIPGDAAQLHRGSGTDQPADCHLSRLHASTHWEDETAA